MSPNHARRMSSNASNNTAFSLMELLVVIAIIALLVALLLPVLRMSKEAARNLQCMNQMRSVNQATMTYVADNRSRYISASHQLRDKRWTVLLVKQYGLYAPTLSCPTRVGLEKRVAHDLNTWHNIQNVSGMLDFPWQRPHYGFNFNLSYVRSNKLVNPAATVAFAPSGQKFDLPLTAFWSEGMTFVIAVPHSYSIVSVHREQSVANIAWADGHVTPMKADEPGSMGYQSYYSTDRLGTQWTDGNSWTPNGKPK